MQRRDVQRLRDIKSAIRKILDYWGSTQDDDPGSDKTWEAILFNLAVIGEASKALSSEARALAPEADWSPAARMRDFVIHHYSEIDRLTVAATIENALPALEAAVDSLLQRQTE